MANVYPFAAFISRAAILILAAGILAGLLFGMLVLRPWEINPPRANLYLQSGAPQVGQAAPDFTLQNLDGESVSLADYRGKTLVLNFWATWCGPCRIEMPLLEETSTAYSQSVQVLTINASEAEADVHAFLDELELNLPVVMDVAGDVQSLYLVRGLPVTFVIDRDGIIRAQHIGLLEASQLAGYLRLAGVEN